MTTLPTRIPSVDVYYTCHLVWVQRLIHVALKRILNAVSARVRSCHLYWSWNHLYTSCKRKLNINYTWITFGSEYLICMLLKHILYVGDFIDTYMTWVHNNDALLTSHLEGLEPTILCLAVARSTDWATGAWPYNHYTVLITSKREKRLLSWVFRRCRGTPHVDVMHRPCNMPYT